VKTLLQLTQKPKVSAARRVTITQREIGQMIGMSPESTNKQLRDWEERNWVRLERGGVVVLKPEALAAIARAPSEE
jgi:CRP/FNR family transcriptional regulator, cyclic AMP receptor protein